MTEQGKSISSKDASADVSAKSGGFEWLCMLLSIIVLAAGIVGYYLFLEESIYISLASLLVGMIVALGFFAFSKSGKTLIAFTKEARMELRRVTWPSKAETSTMTKVVLFVIVLAMIFLGAVDGFLHYAMQFLLSWR